MMTMLSERLKHKHPQLLFYWFYCRPCKQKPFRDDLLDACVFESIDQVREVTAHWAKDYKNCSQRNQDTDIQRYIQ